MRSAVSRRGWISHRAQVCANGDCPDRQSGRKLPVDQRRAGKVRCPRCGLIQRVEQGR